jgi:ureidoacrylate peracid hydrolase
MNLTRRELLKTTAKSAVAIAVYKAEIGSGHAYPQGANRALQADGAGTKIDNLNPVTTCLLFFDCSKIFVNGPSLRAEDRTPMVQAAVKNWQRQQNLARQFRMMVVYANTAQRADQSNYFPRLIDRFQPARLGDERRPMSRAVLGTPEVAVIDEIAPARDEYMFWKDHWDPWQDTGFELAMRRRKVNTVIVNGGSTEVGIVATAFGAHRLSHDIVFVSDGCTSNNTVAHEMLMTHRFPRMGMVRRTDQVLAMLQAGNPG